MPVLNQTPGWAASLLVPSAKYSGLFSTPGSRAMESESIWHAGSPKGFTGFDLDAIQLHSTNCECRVAVRLWFRSISLRLSTDGGRERAVDIQSSTSVIATLLKPRCKDAPGSFLRKAAKSCTTQCRAFRDKRERHSRLRYSPAAKQG